MEALRKIFGTDVPDPVKTAATKWKSDEFARGSYSYIPVGATGKDYESMAQPVHRKLFFAGEATWRFNPATVPGAFISGLRAAGAIHDVGIK